MPEFLVERYVPRLDAAAVTAIAARVERAAAELGTAGLDVRWLRSVAAVEEELCFCFFTARALDDVVAANERAGVDYERIAEVFSIEHAEVAPPAAVPPAGATWRSRAVTASARERRVASLSGRLLSRLLGMHDCAHRSPRSCAGYSRDGHVARHPMT